MSIRLANFLSKLFHPLFMPVLGMAIIFSSPTYFNYRYPFLLKVIVLGFLFLNTFIFPLIFSLLLKRRGAIKSLQMETCKERKWPYFFTTIMYLTSVWLFVKLNISSIILDFTLGAAVSIFILFLASFINFKISAHLLGLGGLIGMILVLSLKTQVDLTSIISAFILISGFVGIARLILKAHQPIEIYTGFLVGFLIQLYFV
ncbi:PA-phosphatase [Acidiluteibacter ferrifornacis]|uniref:PA-phosphatase n=1 Tax=Acidiluteibacter ferrifornacis TaxID=2692424 RepID=A0A6N9NGB7_9FLAO|nr:PA-phosphatase [Acidiluteibacter ferrifornacis]NBG64844.1 PA-phosphatase [Acidiluteibacter ferrifornacis]